MRIRCIHGYFKFDEFRPGEMSRFMSLTNLSLESQDDYYTFSSLAGAPKYSLLGGKYLGALATKTFEGEPWEILKENSLVYDFIQDLVLPIDEIISPVTINRSMNYFTSNGMIIPGSLTDAGERVTDYAAYYIFDTGKFKYSEVVSG